MNFWEFYLLSIAVSFLLTIVSVFIAKHTYKKSFGHWFQDIMTGKDLVLMIVLSFLPIFNLILFFVIMMTQIVTIVFDPNVKFGSKDKGSKWKEFLDKSLW